MAKSTTRGFTLVELMIVVAIIGVLSAVAIPAFMRYMAKAKTAEATTMLRRMAEGARSYYLETHGATGSLGPTAKQFPATNARTPAVSCCVQGAKCTPNPADWDDPTWKSLTFAVTDPHYYQYSFTSSGTSVGASFTARANGDLDCDGNESTFEMYGSIRLADGDPTGSRVTSQDDTE